MALPLLKDLDAALDVLLTKREGKLGQADSQDLLDLLEKVHSVDRKAIELELVNELRNRGETWALIGDYSGADATTAFARYSEKSVPAKKPRLTPANMPGYSVKEAAAELGITPPTVYHRIEKAGEAEWWGEFETNGARGAEKRILNLDSLAALVRPRGKQPASAQYK